MASPVSPDVCSGAPCQVNHAAKMTQLSSTGRGWIIRCCPGPWCITEGRGKTIGGGERLYSAIEGGDGSRRPIVTIPTKIRIVAMNTITICLQQHASQAERRGGAAGSLMLRPEYDFAVLFYLIVCDVWATHSAVSRAARRLGSFVVCALVCDDVAMPHSP